MNNFLYLLGRSFVNGQSEDFSAGFRAGYQRFQRSFSLTSHTAPILATELHEINMEVIGVRHSGIWYAGFISGFYCAFYVAGDEHLTRISMQVDEASRRILEQQEGRVELDDGQTDR